MMYSTVYLRIYTYLYKDAFCIYVHRPQACLYVGHHASKSQIPLKETWFNRRALKDDINLKEIELLGNPGNVICFSVPQGYCRDVWYVYVYLIHIYDMYAYVICT